MDTPFRTPDPSITARCLVVDDDQQVCDALVRVVESGGLECLSADSASSALALLAAKGEVAILISDIRMPGTDGVALLEEVRRRYPDIAVIMLSAVADVQIAVDCLQRGALDYIAKPMVLGEVQARVAKALEKRKLTLQNRYYRQHLEDEVRRQRARIGEMFLEGAQTLAHALEAKDAYTRGHSQRVREYAVRTAVRLGFTGDFLDNLRLGAELHDIGKIGTREAVLNKPGRLTPDEFRHIAEHTVLGERILAPLARDRPVVLHIARSHHERLDGEGFPDGLKGEAIPMEARIVSVADAFDAMTTNRAYRETLAPPAAFEELERCAGPQFEPAVVGAFLEAFPDPARLPIHPE
ncbi:MAG TPA: HD domain-containing phosphohydrolase [Gemmatimonadales bacterium]|nr:HD domain-containing phosphohydrolase [Gemmatimonadales bacterium]